MRFRPRAEVICFKGNRVLVDLRPYVCFPGGGIEAGESPVMAAKREALEECGRCVISVAVAHPPSTQKWPGGYRMDWQKGFDGGITYWLTGSTSEDPTNKTHRDYQPGFHWAPIAVVLDHLRKETDGPWADDVAVRISILEQMLAVVRPVPSTFTLHIAGNRP